MIEHLHVAVVTSLNITFLCASFFEANIIDAKINVQ